MLEKIEQINKILQCEVYSLFIGNGFYAIAFQGVPVTPWLTEHEALCEIEKRLRYIMHSMN